MRHAVRSSLAASMALSFALVGFAGAPVAAARTTTTSTTGNDISWPQCGKSFPSGQAFGIVGVNGGLANNQNPCLGPSAGGSTATSELAWALGSIGTPKLAWKAALYVNTADPSPAVADWPKDNVDRNGADEGPGGLNLDPFGACDGTDSPACAWQYGWDRSTWDIYWLAAAAGQISVSGASSAYVWWLDVETGNSWETGTLGLANNVADLQGMTAAFEAGSAVVGVYSTSSQWGTITGGSRAGNLGGLADWIPGARTQSGAKSNCSLSGFTGPVVLTQWFGKPFDGDVAC